MKPFVLRKPTTEKPKLNVETITEMRNEWILRDEVWRRFFLIITFVFGIPTIKYGVYYGETPVIITRNQQAAVEQFNKLEQNVEPSVILDEDLPELEQNPES